MLFRSHPELPDVPTAIEQAKTPEDAQILKLVLAPWTYGRPVVTPPEVPRDRLAVLRAAFAKTMQDAEFLADMQKLQLEVRPFAPEKMQALIADLYATPKDVVERTRKIISEP